MGLQWRQPLDLKELEKPPVVDCGLSVLDWEVCLVSLLFFPKRARARGAEKSEGRRAILVGFGPVSRFTQEESSTPGID